MRAERRGAADAGTDVASCPSAAPNKTSSGPLNEAQANALRDGLAGLRASGFSPREEMEPSEAEVGISSGTARINVSFGAIVNLADGESVRRVFVEGRPDVLLVPEPAPTDLLALLRSLR